MALYYDIQLVRQIAPEQLKQQLEQLSQSVKAIKTYFKEKAFDQVLTHARVMESATNAFGMETACEEARQVIQWAEQQGKKKEIKSTLESLRTTCKQAKKEIQKDFLQ